MKSVTEERHALTVIIMSLFFRILGLDQRSKSNLASTISSPGKAGSYRLVDETKNEDYERHPNDRYSDVNYDVNCTLELDDSLFESIPNNAKYSNFDDSTYSVEKDNLCIDSFIRRPTSRKEKENNSLKSLLKCREEPLGDINIAFYTKYIPVDNINRSSYPKSKTDKVYPQCWFEVQSWFMKTKLRLLQVLDSESQYSLTTPSKSDTAIRGKFGFKSKRSKSSIFQKGQYATTKKFDKSSFNALDSLGKGAYPLLRNISKTYPRFGSYVNEQYCKIASSLKPHFYTELYMQMPQPITKEPNFSLCHMKTELIVCCLQKFFFSRADNVHIMWVNDIQQQIGRFSLNENAILLQDVSAALDVKALMIISPEVRILFKHNDLSFFDTLSIVMEVPRNQMMMFELDTFHSTQLI